MKKLLLAIVGLVAMSGFARAQVIETFDTSSVGLGIFKNALWGTVPDTIAWAPDPTGKSAGVMRVHFDLTGTGGNNAIRPVTQAWLKLNGTQLLTYWVYIPKGSGIPDSLDFELWWQNSSNWTWRSVHYYAMNIPKGVWYPLSAPVAQVTLANPSDGALSTFMFGDFGIQWNNNHVGASTANWSGDIYVDSVALVGKNPTPITDPMTVQWTNSHTASITSVAGPIGGLSNVWADSLTGGTDAGGGAAFGDQPGGSGLAAHVEHFLVTWVYVDTTFPDTGYIQTWAQSDPSWNWPPNGPVTYNGNTIPKQVWYPLYFDLAQASELDTVSGSFFNTIASANDLRKLGIQIGGTNWTGAVYMTNVSMIHDSIYVAPPPPPPSVVSVLADFDKAPTAGHNGLEGFAVPSYANGTLTRTTFPITGDTTYVMAGAADFSQSLHKFAAVVSNVVLSDTSNSSNVPNALAFSMYIPSGLPQGLVVQFFVSGGLNDSLSIIDTLNNQVLKTHQWNTLTISKVDSATFKGKFNPANPATVGVIAYYPGDTTAWAGNFLFDNLDVYGISEGKLIDGVKNPSNNLPTVYQLYNNYPNPFNPSTVIKYDLPKDSKVVLEVYDVLGREVATLVNGKQQAGGRYEVRFDGSRFSSGVYFFRITAGDYVKTQKMLLIK